MLRHWVVAVAAPGVTAEDAADSQVKAFERAVFTESLKGILRAGRSKPACRTAFQRRQANLIEPDKKDKRENGDLFKKAIFPFIIILCSHCYSLGELSISDFL